MALPGPVIAVEPSLPLCPHRIRGMLARVIWHHFTQTSLIRARKAEASSPSEKGAAALAELTSSLLETEEHLGQALFERANFLRGRIQEVGVLYVCVYGVWEGDGAPRPKGGGPPPPGGGGG
jgi:hypothetical protein